MSEISHWVETVSPAPERQQSTSLSVTLSYRRFLAPSPEVGRRHGRIDNLVSLTLTLTALANPSLRDDYTIRLPVRSIRESDSKSPL